MIASRSSSRVCQLRRLRTFFCRNEKNDRRLEPGELHPLRQRHPGDPGGTVQRVRAPADRGGRGPAAANLLSPRLTQRRGPGRSGTASETPSDVVAPALPPAGQLGAERFGRPHRRRLGQAVLWTAHNPIRQTWWSWKPPRPSWTRADKPVVLHASFGAVLKFGGGLDSRESAITRPA